MLVMQMNGMYMEVWSHMIICNVQGILKLIVIVIFTSPLPSAPYTMGWAKNPLSWLSCRTLVFTRASIALRFALLSLAQPDFLYYPEPGAHYPQWFGSCHVNHQSKKFPQRPAYRPIWWGHFLTWGSPHSKYLQLLSSCHKTSQHIHIV